MRNHALKPFVQFVLLCLKRLQSDGELLADPAADADRLNGDGRFVPGADHPQSCGDQQEGEHGGEERFVE